MYVHDRRYRKKRSKKPPLFILAVGIIIFVVLAGTVRSTFTFPTVQGQSEFSREISSPSSIDINWPKYGQSAIGASGYGVLEQSGDKKPQPTASVAKVMTALAVLEKQPFEYGEQGQYITFTEKDAELFGEYWAKNGTSVNIKPGTKVSQYEALQYVLIPSANNVSDTLVIWAFGSMEEYVEYANEFAKEIGLNDSYFADASGFSPKTISTAADLVRLGEKAMENPIIREIVGTWDVKLPSGTKAQNSNVFLDFEGNNVIGIKTGDTDQAKGVYLFAAEHTVGGETVTIIGSVMGAKTLYKAQQDAMKLLNQAKKGFEKVDVVSGDEVIGQYDIPWQSTIDIKPESKSQAVVWKNSNLNTEVVIDDLDAAYVSGTEAGSINLNLGSHTIEFPIVTQEDVTSPPLRWKLTHPKYFSTN